MELTNHTRYPAGLARIACAEDMIAASALVRVTYDLREGALAVSDEQPWIVSMEPWNGPKGPMDGDFIFYKGGADVFLFGRAVPEGGRPAPQSDVELRVGQELARRVRVFGRRIWRRTPAGLAPTDPEPFSEMPLTLAYAFGGKDAWDELEIPWSENPEGLGAYTTEESAEGKPLPCIEEIDHLITKWTDRPPVAGLGPLPIGSPIRSQQGLAEDEDGELMLTPRFFNAAFARMIAERINPGDDVVITGVSASGALRFSIPAIPFVLKLGFGAGSYDLPFAVDQVGVEAEESRVFIAYRAPFRYTIRELEERRAELCELG